MKNSKTLGLIVLAGALAFADVPAADAKHDSGISELFESSFAHEVTGNIERSLGEVLKILGRSPDHYIANYRAAWLYYLDGKYAQSVKHYTKASSLQPKALEPRLGMMLPLMASKQWSAAEKLGLEILKIAPNNYLAGSRLGYIYFSQGRYRKAEQQYAEVLENFPSELEMMLGLGWTYLRQGRKAEARKMFEEVLSIRRHNLNARAGLEAL